MNNLFSLNSMGKKCFAMIVDQRLHLIFYMIKLNQKKWNEKTNGKIWNIRKK